MNRYRIQDAYVERILDGMGMKELLMFAANKLHAEYALFTDEELYEDVGYYYPDILEDMEDA
jgi:hypothetical protein